MDDHLRDPPLDEWAEVFAAEPDFFWSPVNSLEDVVADEQFHAAGGIVDVPDGESSVAMVATPADFDGTPWAPRSAAPELGQHTDEILAELDARREVVIGSADSFTNFRRSVTLSGESRHRGSPLMRTQPTRETVLREERI